MDTGSIAAAMVGARTAQMQLAVAAKMMRMNVEAQGAVAQLLDAAQRNGAQLAAASGLGGNLDISV